MGTNYRDTRRSPMTRTTCFPGRASWAPIAMPTPWPTGASGPASRSWDPALDAVTAAPKQHKVLFENERLRVLEVTLEGHDEEPGSCPPQHLRAEFLAAEGLRRHRGRGAGDDYHALLFLLAILAGGGRRARRSHRARTHRSPEQAPAEISRMRFDTYIGMGYSNVISLFIIVATAATLNANGVTDIQTSAQAAEALRPIAGVFTFALFAAGIIGIGLLAVPVLAASGAYALGEALGWTTGLERKPLDAKAFYVTIAISTLIGVGINFVGLDPIKALFWSAVINGVVAVPLMVIIMLMAMREDVMGEFVLPRALWATGWLSTATMAVVVAIMFATW